MSPIQITDIPVAAANIKDTSTQCPLRFIEVKLGGDVSLRKCNVTTEETHQTYICVMLGLSATSNYYLFNGSVDLRKGVFELTVIVKNNMENDPLNGKDVFIFMSSKRKVVKIMSYKHGFFVLRKTASL